MRRLIFISLLLISGCATFGQFDKNLPELIGNHIEEVNYIWGIPDGTYPLGNNIVYIWSTNQDFNISLPQQTNVSGFVGTTPVWGTATTYQSVPVNSTCTIKLMTENGYIKDYTYSGNLYGCEWYINQLKKYVKDKQKKAQEETQQWIDSLDIPE